MEKEKVLEIEFKEVWDNNWAWRIIKNEIPFSEFFTKVFYNDIGMYSKNKDSLFLEDVSGNYANMISDNNLIDEKEKIRIEIFVKFINEKYGIPKRWRAAPHEKFFCIYANGEVSTTQDDYGSYKESFYELGNYFQTEEEAQKIINSKEWQDFWAKVRAGEIGGENENRD